MDITIYQINKKRDMNGTKFCGLEALQRSMGNTDIDSAIYDKVFEGTVPCNSLEDVFQMFNADDKPEGFLGHSLSVSDVVGVTLNDGSIAYKFCDSVGFKDVYFDPSITKDYKDTLMRVVMVNPGEKAKIEHIEYSLRKMQNIVKGEIEVIYPYEKDNVCLVCNGNGKIDGLPLNRVIRINEEISDMSYADMVSLFRNFERENTSKEHMTGYIVFSEKSFSQPYSEESRTYIVSSDNKAFIPNKGGYSIYGSALDGSDPLVRLERYMAAEKGGSDGWEIERCYMKSGGSVADIIAGPFFVCGTDEDEMCSLTPEQAAKYMAMFLEPEDIELEFTES